MTRAEIIDRLKANGNPSLFEEAVLRYIRELEAEIRGLRSYCSHYIIQDIELMEDKLTTNQ